MKNKIIVMLLILSMIFGNVNIVLADTETNPIKIKAKVSLEPKLIWSDEFEGTELESTKWKADEFNSYYSSSRSLDYDLECYEVKDGNLVIKPEFKWNKSNEKVVNGSLKSAKIWTRGLCHFKYGKIEVRAKLPKGQGTAPMAWMLGENNVWPLCGEIDILELNMGIKNQIVQSLHCNMFNGMPTSTGNKYKITNVPDSTNEYHTYGIIWDKEKITYTIDGVETWTYNPDEYSDTDDGNKNSDIWPFNQPFYLILKCDIGEWNCGILSPENWTKIATNDDIETYQDYYYIDYVRVYDLEGYVKPKAQVSKIRKFSAINKKGRKVKLIWNKVDNAKGYQIIYARNKKFTKGKKLIFTKKRKYTIKKLKKNKTYYFKVRAYKGKKNARLYGRYSKVRKVKIKK